VTTETKKFNKISRVAIEHFRPKAKPADFRPMFHGEPAGIRSQSSETVVIRSGRLAAAAELKVYQITTPVTLLNHDFVLIFNLYILFLFIFIFIFILNITWNILFY
jgi:hypothetical protein